VPAEATGSIFEDMLESVKWRVAISCPLSGSKGSAILSESADELHYARRIEVLTPGFLGTEKDSPRPTIFWCVECQVSASSEPQGILSEPRPEPSGTD
jgi:hypothetical protein